MEYQVEILPPVIKSLQKIDKRYIKKIKERIDLLKIDPRHNGSIKLSGAKNAYRTRVGVYRIIYTIQDEKILVTVFDIDHRKDVYKP